MAVGAQYFARQNTYMVDVFLFVVLTSVRPALPKSGGNQRHVFGSWVSDANGAKQRDRSAWIWRRLSNVHVLLHVRAYVDCPVSLAMTHMRWKSGQSGHKSTDDTQSVVHCVGGLQAWPIDMCSEQGRGQK